MDRKPTESSDPEVMELLESDDPGVGDVPSAPVEGEGPKTTDKPVEIELLSFDSGIKDKWSGSTYSRGCVVVACALGAIILIAVFMGGYSSLKRSVWVSFDAACERVSTGLPFEMTADQRKKIRVDMKTLSEMLQEMDDPFETMGRFTSEVNLSFRDGLLSMRDVERIEKVLDEVLRSEASEALPE